MLCPLFAMSRSLLPMPCALLKTHHPFLATCSEHGEAQSVPGAALGALPKQRAEHAPEPNRKLLHLARHLAVDCADRIGEVHRVVVAAVVEVVVAAVVVVAFRGRSRLLRRGRVSWSEGRGRVSRSGVAVDFEWVRSPRVVDEFVLERRLDHVIELLE
jgi:hypothetical protein